MILAVTILVASLISARFAVPLVISQDEEIQKIVFWALVPGLMVISAMLGLGARVQESPALCASFAVAQIVLVVLCAAYTLIALFSAADNRNEPVNVDAVPALVHAALVCGGAVLAAWGAWTGVATTSLLRSEAYSRIF